jgi:hypothetical protein
MSGCMAGEGDLIVPAELRNGGWQLTWSEWKGVGPAA